MASRSLMSDLGHSRRFGRSLPVSSTIGHNQIAPACLKGANVPHRACLLDHLVGETRHRWNGEAARFRGREIDGHLEFGRLYPRLIRHEQPHSRRALEAFLATFGPSASARIRSFRYGYPRQTLSRSRSRPHRRYPANIKIRSIELPSGVIRDHDSVGSRFDGELGILNIENSHQDKFCRAIGSPDLRRRRETII